MKTQIVLLGIFLLAGCSDGELSRAGGTITARDSAGIEIVDHPAGFEDALPEWVVDSNPQVDIGGREEPGHDLHLVGGAVHLQDGRIVVINRGSSELRFFDATGRYLAAAGRQGRGPGEFSEFISSIQVLAGDTLFAIDGSQNRGSLFTPSGEFIRSIPTFHYTERSSLGTSALLRDGQLLGEHRQSPEMKETSGPVRRNPYAIVLMRAIDSLLDTLIVVPGTEVYPATGSEGGQEFPTLRGLEFGRSTTFSTDGARIFVGTNEPDGIRVYDNLGKLLRIVRTATPPEAVTEELRKRREAETLNRINQRRASEQLKAEWRKNAATPRYAATLPYYGRLVPGPEGTLWLERVPHFLDEGRRFVVYDSTGRAIATVRCPDRMRPYVVGPESIIGLWRDPDGVDHVRVYKVGRTAAQ